MSNYADIANLSWDEIQEPKPVPDGTWLLQLRNVTFQPSKDAEANPLVMFVHTPKEPMDDVSTDALDALGEGYDVSENKIFTRIYIEDGSSWGRVRTILKHHGFEVSGDVTASFKKASKDRLVVLGHVSTQRFTRKDGSAGESNVVNEWAKVE